MGSTTGMTLHYHGTPITPRAVLKTLKGRCFCVSFVKPQDVEYCHEIGQSVMLDNGAFSAWRRGITINWRDYYMWAEPWLEYATTWAVIPDVIDGNEEANDALVKQWPFGDAGAPVWHMHESIDRLLRLCNRWDKVCIGSSSQYSKVRSPEWHARMTEVFNVLCKDNMLPGWIHMLRGMALSGSHYPFASVDSTDVARNHNRAQNTAMEMAYRWDAMQCPKRWICLTQ